MSHQLKITMCVTAFEKLKRLILKKQIQFTHWFNEEVLYTPGTCW